MNWYAFLIGAILGIPVGIFLGSQIVKRYLRKNLHW